MTRRDYEAVARGIARSSVDHLAKRKVAESVADQIEGDRRAGTFDRRRFVDAATRSR